MKRVEKQTSATEYREKADKHLEKIKGLWILFGKTGLFVLAAIVVIIGLCAAWFASNNEVYSGTMEIQGADNSSFELASAGSASDIGYWDSFLPVTAYVGKETVIGGHTYFTTEGKSSIRWMLTQNSQFQNQNEDVQSAVNQYGEKVGIHPGTSGSITFYILAKRDGALKVNFDISLAGFDVATNENGSDTLETVTPGIQALLEGHVLLFSKFDEANNTYAGWISKDADKWSMSLSYGENGEAVLEKDSSDFTNLVWSKDDVKLGEVYPVTLYWVWPEVFGEFVYKDPSIISDRPVLFLQDCVGDDDTNPYAMPKDFMEKLCEKPFLGQNHNRYFLWPLEKAEEFEDTVTLEALKKLREENGGNKLTYGKFCEYYNRADQYLGVHVRYLYLNVNANEKTD